MKKLDIEPVNTFLEHMQELKYGDMVISVQLIILFLKGNMTPYLREGFDIQVCKALSLIQEDLFEDKDDLVAFILENFK